MDSGGDIAALQLAAELQRADCCCQLALELSQELQRSENLFLLRRSPEEIDILDRLL